MKSSLGEFSVCIEVTRQSCQLRSFRSAITSSRLMNAHEDMPLSLKVERERLRRSIVSMASVNTFCRS